MAHHEEKYEPTGLTIEVRWKKEQVLDYLKDADELVITHYIGRLGPPPPPPPPNGN